MPATLDIMQDENELDLLEARLDARDYAAEQEAEWVAYLEELQSTCFCDDFRVQEYYAAGENQ